MDPIGGPTQRVPKLLYAATAFEALGYGAIFALLAELQDEYHLPTYGLGLIAGTSFLAGLGAQVGLARYADRGYTRLLLRVGLAVAAAGMLWFGLASQLWEFIGARLLLGLGSGMFVPAARRVVVSRSGPKSGEALGRLASVEVAGFISGPPIAALLAALFGLHAPFLFLAAALALDVTGRRADRGATGRCGATQARAAGAARQSWRALRSGARRGVVPVDRSVRRDLGALHDGPGGEHHRHRGDARVVRAATRRAQSRSAAGWPTGAVRCGVASSR